MERAVLSFIDILEAGRINGLRLILGTDMMRRAFRNRAVRLSLLFALSVLIYLPLSLFFPLWVLAIGPLVWGIPHIFASLRYQNEIAVRSSQAGPRQDFRRALFFSCAVWAGITLFRLYTDVLQNLSVWDRTHPGIIEAGFAILLLAGLSHIFRRNLKQLLISAVILVPLTLALWHLPLAVSGILILAHNFVACIFWILAAKEDRDRKVAIGATFVFVAIHALVFMKAFDEIINLVPIASTLAWSGMSIDGLGHMIVPWSDDLSVWYRSVSLYAFGQSIHYFIWLKAIPDLQTQTQIPTSIRTSWNFLKRDFGLKLAIAACALSLIPLGVWVFLSFEWAHNVYFAFASCHGYFEFAGLGLLAVKFGSSRESVKT